MTDSIDEKDPQKLADRRNAAKMLFATTVATAAVATLTSKDAKAQFGGGDIDIGDLADALTEAVVAGINATIDQDILGIFESLIVGPIAGLPPWSRSRSSPFFDSPASRSSTSKNPAGRPMPILPRCTPQ